MINLSLSSSYTIFYPALFMVLLTFLVLIYMFRVRVNFMKTGKARLSKFSTRASTAEVTKDIASSADNFMNLFEVPVLFYFLTIVIFVTNSSDNFFLVLFSTYVFFRYIHSFIQCTYNNVNHRFYAYALSVFILLIVFIRLFIQLVF